MDCPRLTRPLYLHFILIKYNFLEMRSFHGAKIKKFLFQVLFLPFFVFLSTWTFDGLPNVDNCGYLANYHLPHFVHVVIEQQPLMQVFDFNLSSTCCYAQITSLKCAWFYRETQKILLSIWIPILDKIKWPGKEDKKNLLFEQQL